MSKSDNTEPFSWKTFIQKYRFLIGLILLVLISIGLIWSPQGKSVSRSFQEWLIVKGTGWHANEVLWDWLDLLIVPIALLLGGVWFNHIQKRSDRIRTKEAKDIEHEIEAERQKQSALNDYFSQMTHLILEKKLQTTEDENVRLLAKARTENILRQMDAKRNQQVLSFLRNAELTGNAWRPFYKNDERDSFKHKGLLLNADLKGVDFEELELWGINFTGARFDNANLRNAVFDTNSLRLIETLKMYNTGLSGISDISEASFVNADLRGINFTSVYTYNNNLIGADLREATFCDSSEFPKRQYSSKEAGLSLRSTNVKEKIIQGDKLDGALLPDGRSYKEWSKDKKGLEKQISGFIESNYLITEFDEPLEK